MAKITFVEKLDAIVERVGSMITGEYPHLDAEEMQSVFLGAKYVVSTKRMLSSDFRVTDVRIEVEDRTEENIVMEKILNMVHREVGRLIGDFPMEFAEYLLYDQERKNSTDLYVDVPVGNAVLMYHQPLDIALLYIDEESLAKMEEITFAPFKRPIAEHRRKLAEMNRAQ